MSPSRANLIRKAVRPAMNARLMLSGPPGSGKTWTALTIAERLAEGGRIAVIDTEVESALTYADQFDFDHLAWDPPYNPLDCAATIHDLGRDHRVILIDSASHFWKGVLEIADGKYGGWRSARPAQHDWVQAILRSPAHMIICTRAKQAHEVSEYTDDKGKKRQSVEKLGLAPIQDAEFEYELNVAADIDMQHRLSIGKTRCSALDGRTFQPGHAVDMADLYREWLKGGQPIADRGAIEELVDRMNAITDSELRTACKREFVTKFGTPDLLAADQLEAAREHVAKSEKAGKATAPAPPPSDPTPEPAPPAPPAETDVARWRKRIMAEAGKHDGLTDDRRHALMRQATGDKVASVSQITNDDQASRIVTALKDYGAGKYVFEPDGHGGETLRLAGQQQAAAK